MYSLGYIIAQYDANLLRKRNPPMSHHQPGPKNLITDVDGITVGNAVDAKVRTGVSVVLPTPRAVAAVDVRGGGPGSRETDALNPENLVQEIDAIVLSGGSVYGLDAASGVVGWLAARGRGFTFASSNKVAPIVPAAILFDLTNGGDKEWGETAPYTQLGAQAVAVADTTFDLGNVGAGYGAQAGTLKGGLGSASVVTSEGLQVGALIAVNPFGSVVVPGTKNFWAAPFEQSGEFGGAGWPQKMPTPSDDFFHGTKAEGAGAKLVSPGTNTTIGVIAVNAKLSQTECKRVAMMAHDGLARAIRPIHTPVDGDTLYVISTGTVEVSEAARPLAIAQLGSLAADVVARAVARGVYEATSLGDLKAYAEV